MSTTAETRAASTPEDLLLMPDGKNYELVDGNLVERNVSALSSWVAAKLIGMLRIHCEANRLEWLFGPDCGFQCFPEHPRTVRRPDVSFVHRDRLSVEQLDEGYIRVAPDLAVEVVSPNDLFYEVEQKVREYLEAGVRLIWVVSPMSRMVTIHRSDGSVCVVGEHAELTGEDVLPGFRCRVGDLFPPTPVAAPGA
jgi:Uma2 family endonuclease